MEELKHGDFIVSLNSNFYREEGEIFKVVRSRGHKVTYKLARTVHRGQTRDTNKDNFRLATEEEANFWKEEGTGANIKNMSVSFDEATMYKKGDRVVVKAGMQQGIEFGTHHYPYDVDYIANEELTIKRVSGRREYIMEERNIKLKDALIDHSKTKTLEYRNLQWENLIPGEYYSFIHKEFEEKTIVKFDHYFVTDVSKQFLKWTSVSMTNENFRHKIKKANKREIEWLNTCISKDKYISYKKFKENIYMKAYNGVVETEVELPVFPQSGWCAEFDEDLLKFIGEKAKTNILKRCKDAEKCGVAWVQDSRNVRGERVWNAYTIKHHSSKKKYSLNQLKKFLPQKSKCVAIDIETGGLGDKISWTSGLANYVSGDNSIGIFGAARSFGKSAFNQKLKQEMDEVQERKRYMDNLLGVSSHFQGMNTDRMGYIDSHTEYMMRRRQEEIEEWERRNRDLANMMMEPFGNDRFIASTMAMQAQGRSLRKKKDEFTQPEPILLKNKKKKRKLILG